MFGYLANIYPHPIYGSSIIPKNQHALHVFHRNQPPSNFDSFTSSCCSLHGVAPSNWPEQCLGSVAFKPIRYFRIVASRQRGVPPSHWDFSQMFCQKGPSPRDEPTVNTRGGLTIWKNPVVRVKVFLLCSLFGGGIGQFSWLLICVWVRIRVGRCRIGVGHSTGTFRWEENYLRIIFCNPLKVFDRGHRGQRI
ncbi:expressed unknown protein [Seminavis robusta]|uniref:Uncharacterized protein n=1 Tax=Seminavis robusta TaxID=568900 RepID=A0A9N8HI45_9STRA|nr:expressed unknown protein [Seminavis robusta]|eukprot:Sro571_g168711.1  (193) ;mRNA; r:55164-55967